MDLIFVAQTLCLVIIKNYLQVSTYLATLATKYVFINGLF